MKARLQWLVPIETGVSLPRGQRFAMPAKFEHQGSDWTKNAWSLIVESIGPLNGDGTQEVYVSFLANNAPIEWLAPGKRFSLEEGRSKVAEGEILAGS